MTSLCGGFHVQLAHVANLAFGHGAGKDDQTSPHQALCLKPARIILCREVAYVSVTVCRSSEPPLIGATPWLLPSYLALALAS